MRIGLSTIRAYTASERFVMDNFHRVDESNRAYWSLMASNRYASLGLRCLAGLGLGVICQGVVVISLFSPLHT